jgi:hypothetical protein
MIIYINNWLMNRLFKYLLNNYIISYNLYKDTLCIKS